MKNKIVGVLLVAALCVTALAGCTGDQKPVETESSSSSSSSASQAESTPKTSAPESGAPSSAAPNSTKPASEPPESSPGQVIPVETDNQGFDDKFKDNPIDKAYIQDNNKAISNKDMVEVSEKYAEIWRKETDAVYSTLLGKVSDDRKETLKKEQQAWSDGTESALESFHNDAQAVGGSMAQVDEASRVMDYYRSRAAALYKELYTLDPSYTYHYAG